MSALAEVSNVVQWPGEPRRRWFAAETIDLLLWVDEQDAPVGFQLGWRDGGISHAVTACEGVPLSHALVDEGSRGGAGFAQSPILLGVVDDYDLSLIQPRFAVASRALPVELRDYVLRHLGTPISTETAPLARPLAGMTVLVTRPLRQARKLVAALEAVGAEPRLLPLIAIRPPVEPAGVQLHAHRRAAAWLFTSVNAVAAADNMFSARHWQAPVYAVGEATAKALKQLGHEARRPPPDAVHSEGLLGLPELQAVAGQTVLIVTGEGGRDGLREPLQARGAQVEVATVYRRELVPHLPETIHLTLEGIHAVLLTSGEALVALHRRLPTVLKPRVLQLPLVLPSRRVQAMARTLGFSEALVAATVSDEAFVEALIAWRGGRPA